MTVYYTWHFISYTPLRRVTCRLAQLKHGAKQAHIFEFHFFLKPQITNGERAKGMKKRTKEGSGWEKASKIFFSSFFRGKITKIFSISDLFLEDYFCQ